MTLGAWVSIFSRCPQKCPHNHLAAQEPPRTSLDVKIPPFEGFSRVLSQFLTSPDVAGSLWNWDGWAPHLAYKHLIVGGKYFCVYFEAPKKALRTCGFLGTSAHLRTPTDRRFGSIESSTSPETCTYLRDPGRPLGFGGSSATTTFY